MSVVGSGRGPGLLGSAGCCSKTFRLLVLPTTLLLMMVTLQLLKFSTLVIVVAGYAYC